MILKTLIKLTLVLLVVLSVEFVCMKYRLLDALRYLNVAYNPLINRSSKKPDETEFDSGNHLLIWSTLSLFFGLSAFLGRKYSWFEKCGGIIAVQPPPPNTPLQEIHRLHHLLSGIVQPTHPYPLRIYSSLLPQTRHWSTQVSEEECTRYLNQNSEELVEAMKDLLNLIQKLKSKKLSEENQQVSEVHTLDPKPLGPPSEGRIRLIDRFSLPTFRQAAASPPKRTDDAAELGMRDPVPSPGSNRSYVIVPQKRRKRVMNIEIEFGDEENGCGVEQFPL